MMRYLRTIFSTVFIAAALFSIYFNYDNLLLFVKSNTWSAAFLTAMAVIILRIYFGWLSSQQKYYVYLGDIWYRLKEQSIENPEWINPEWTSVYSYYKTLEGRNKYESHAWMCWALAADCYETYKNENVYAKVSSWIAGVDFFSQFDNTIRVINELHRPWLTDDKNMRLFDDNFKLWLENRYKLPNVRKSPIGTKNNFGVFSSDEIGKGFLIGFFSGEPEDGASQHSIQIGKDLHLNVSDKCVFRYLNHSDNPNAFVRGVNIYALINVAPNTELTINYNATENEINPPFNSDENISVPGFKNLDSKDKKDLRNIAASWNN